MGAVTLVGSITVLGLLEEIGLRTDVGLTVLETAAGKVLTGAGSGIGWLEGWDWVAGVVAGVVAGIGGVDVVPTGGLERLVLGVFDFARL